MCVFMQKLFYANLLQCNLTNGEFGSTNFEPIPHSRVRVLCFVCLIKLCGFMIVSRSQKYVRQFPETVVNQGLSWPQASETVVGLLIKNLATRLVRNLPRIP